MPRQNGGSDSTLRTRKWRAGVKAAKRPETDAVDTALAVAVAVYAHSAATKGSERDKTRVSALEKMAVGYLVSKGFSVAHAERQVRRRVRRLDVGDLILLVNGTSVSGRQ